jgi:hypothetical protein
MLCVSCIKSCFSRPPCVTGDYSSLATDPSQMFHLSSGGPTEMTSPNLPSRLPPPMPNPGVGDSKAWVDAGYGVVMLCYQNGCIPTVLAFVQAH